MLKKKPYLLLFIASVLFLILGFFVSDKVLDINVHDTYYVVGYRHLCWLVAEMLALITLLYWVLDKTKVVMIPILSTTHVYGTLTALVFIFLLNLLPFASTKNYYTNTRFPLFDDLENINLYTSLTALLFLIIQFLFIINIFASIIKKLSKSVTLE